MATTGSNFVGLLGTATRFIGSATVAGPKVLALDSNSTDVVEAGGDAVPLDRVTFDASLTALPALGNHVGACAKNGCALVTLTGTTAVSFDLTDITVGGTQPAAGDTTFASVKAIIFNNVGTHDLTIAPGGSNPAGFPKFTGTSPTLSVQAGGIVADYAPVAITVDSTHKIITITPTAGGVIAITVMGS